MTLPISPSRGGQKRKLRTGLWIRDHLLSVTSDTIPDMKRQFKVECRQIGVRPPTYHSFYQYFWLLIKMGLVVSVAEEALTDEPEAKFIRVKEGKIVPPAVVWWSLTDRGSSAPDEIWGDPLSSYMAAKGPEAHLKFTEDRKRTWVEKRGEKKEKKKRGKEVI